MDVKSKKIWYNVLNGSKQSETVRSGCASWMDIISYLTGRISMDALIQQSECVDDNWSIQSFDCVIISIHLKRIVICEQDRNMYVKFAHSVSVLTHFVPVQCDCLVYIYQLLFDKVGNA